MWPRPQGAEEGHVISPILRDFPDSFPATLARKRPRPPHMLNAGAAESRKKRNRLRAKARRRLRLVEDIPIAAHMEGVALTDDEWRTTEKLARHAEPLTEEADRLGDELKRRRPKVSDNLPI